MEILKPYRARINVIDEQIIELLRRRYEVIDEVGHFKAQKNIPAVIPERVAEVRENAAALAEKKGMDADFIRKLYAQLIEHSCAMEEKIIQQHNRKKAS
ncbi:MAG: chorismate mutase [Alphaproteobacteria bacterium]